ncbi:FAD binding domain-containing protein [Stagonosporopsis vannaccii]|nr:FAD binding domain-containing protein [Stagonosporopsis vannaccii]
MYLSAILYLLPVAFAARRDDKSPTEELASFADPSIVCNSLKQQYANLTYLPIDEGYVSEAQVQWDSSSWLGPACVFAPQNAQQLSHAVTTFAKTSTLFAMRGGGHMPISNAASINSTGVLISSTNLKTLKLSEDMQTLSVGPGPRWGDVFEYLDGTNMTVIGGRIPAVGVPGLLLGGGISYFSNHHGLASSEGKIKAYEVVLADGTIATVTADCEYSDLYWALQGGANSFALVTRFDLQTFPLKTTLRAQAVFEESEETNDLFLNAVLNFTLKGDEDVHASVVPILSWGPNQTLPSSSGMLVYNGSVPPSTGSFATFYDGTIASIQNSSVLQPISLAEFSRTMRPLYQEGGPGHGLRQRFHVVPLKATRAAMDVLHETWFKSLQETDLANRVPGFLASLAYNTVTKTFAERSQGTPQEFDAIPQFWAEENVCWSNAEDDFEVENFLLDVNKKLKTALEEQNLTVPYLYLNDAGGDQDVFGGYKKENVMRLKAIRKKYDPARVFTDLMPGGFKVAHSKRDIKRGYF